jgi:hypothetical protein
LEAETACGEAIQEVVLIAFLGVFLRGFRALREFTLCSRRPLWRILNHFFSRTILISSGARGYGRWSVTFSIDGGARLVYYVSNVASGGVADTGKD